MQRESCRNTVGHRHPGSPLAQAEEAFAGVTPYLSGIAHPQEGAPPCNPLLCWKRRAGGSQQPSPPPQKPATPTAQGAYSSHRPEPRSLCPPPLEKKQALPWNPFFKEAAAACASLPNAGARPNTAVSCSPDTNVCRYSHTWTPNRSSCLCMCDAGQTQTQEKFPHQDFLPQGQENCRTSEGFSITNTHSPGHWSRPASLVVLSSRTELPETIKTASLLSPLRTTVAHPWMPSHSPINEGLPPPRPVHKVWKRWLFPQTYRQLCKSTINIKNQRNRAPPKEPNTFSRTKYKEIKSYKKNKTHLSKNSK